jgi:hypothetical protein
MTHEEFVNLTEKMRLAQKSYFRTKSAQALDQSKRLEKQVDEAIAKFRDGQKQLSFE